MEKREKFKIEKLNHHGKGIAYYQGKVVFVENAMINEVVEIAIVKEKSRYLEAKATSIIEKSSHRVNVQCPYYMECGGCNLLHMDYQEQLHFKESKVNELIVSLDPRIKQNKIVASSPFYYRNKTTFQVKEKIGYYQSKTYDIISIDHCQIIHPKINELLLYLQENIPLEGIKQIMIRLGTRTDDLMVVISGSKMMKRKEIVEKVKEKVNVFAFYQDGTYKFMTKQKSITEQLGKYSFLISPGSFFQVNTEGAEFLYQEISKHIDQNDRVLDLYCGTGTIGIYISELADTIKGVEINPEAVKDANINKEINHIENIDFLCKSVSRLKNRYPDITTIIVDPPRSGLDTASLNYIMDYNVEKIIYTSCDLMTLRRDLKVLQEKYNIVEVTPIDMFPNTYHVECVVVMSKRTK